MKIYNHKNIIRNGHSRKYCIRAPIREYNRRHRSSASRDPILRAGKTNARQKSKGRVENLSPSLPAKNDRDVYEEELLSLFLSTLPATAKRKRSGTSNVCERMPRPFAYASNSHSAARSPPRPITRPSVRSLVVFEEFNRDILAVQEREG